MSLTPRHPRTRPIGMGHLRAFEAVARHLNFRAAAEELSLTQSAVSRQIQSLEDEVGTSLFLRHTRAVELTSAGGMLLRAASSALERVDHTVRHIRQNAGRKSVAITTWASFASMWLIPRLEAFQRDHPDIDIRIDATDSAVDLATADVDMALRYAVPQAVPPGAVRLFGEKLTPVASPWLLQSHPIQRIEQCVRRLWSMLRHLLETLRDHGSECWRHIVTHRIQRVGDARELRRHRRLRRRAHERRLARQQLVRQQPDRVDVDAVIRGGIGGQLLGRHVRRRPDRHAGRGHA